MDDRQGQGNTFSFQLTTKDTDDLTEVEEISMGNYEQQLTPPVFVPFNATPTCALYDLTFANTMANIDPVYDNDTLVIGFGTNFKFQDPAEDDNFVNEPYDKDGDSYFTTEAQVHAARSTAAGRQADVSSQKYFIF
jgi:hypothetical protein